LVFDNWQHLTDFMLEALLRRNSWLVWEGLNWELLGIITATWWNTKKTWRSRTTRSRSRTAC